MAKEFFLSTTGNSCFVGKKGGSSFKICTFYGVDELERFVREYYEYIIVFDNELKLFLLVTQMSPVDPSQQIVAGFTEKFQAEKYLSSLK